MPTVDFFEVRGRRWEEALCQRVEEEQAAGQRVYVWASSEAQSRGIDDLLWTFRDDSFVPHSLWQGENPFDEAVAVGWQPGNPNRASCLVLARDASASEIKSFDRVIDFAPVDDPALRDAARVRFRTFRDAGFAVTFHREA